MAFWYLFVPRVYSSYVNDYLSLYLKKNKDIFILLNGTSLEL